MSRASRTAVTVVAVALLAVVIHGEPVWLSFDATSPQAVPPSVEIVDGDPNHVVYDIKIHGVLVSDTLVEGDVYHRLSFPDEGALGDEGLPELPFVTRIVGYAPDAQTSITAQCEGEVVLLDYLVYPAQPGVTLTYPPSPPPPFKIDSEFYASDTTYPEKPQFLDQLGVWRDLRTDLAGVVPFCYIPGARKLVVYTRIILKVTFGGANELPSGEIELPPGGSGFPPTVAKSRHDAYTNVVSNFEYLGIGIDFGHKDHFIIVLGDNSQELKDAIEPLRIWKTLRGLEVYTPVVGVDFPSEQYQIRNYLAEHYSPNWETAVLLVGDNNTIPAPDDWPTRCPVRPDPPAEYPMKMGSNTWYGCVRGNDSYEDILVGRLASTHPDTVSGYVEKVMHYERYIDEQWMKDSLLFVIDAWEFREPKLWVLGEMPSELGIRVADGANLQHSNDTIVEYLEGNGGVGAVNFFGHGGIWGLRWGPRSWATDDAYGLNNRTWPPIVYSMSCGNGFIRERLGETEGLAEAWIENPHGGAVGVAANTAIGLGNPTANLDWRLNVGAYELTPNRDRLWVGENFQEAKMLVRRRYSDWQGPYSYCALHWMGDPTVNVWTQYLGDLQLDVSPEVMPREIPTTIQATVLDFQGAPVERAWVGLYKTGISEPELLCSAPTDPNGEVIFRSVMVPSVGTILVSAFKDWYRPAEGHILVHHSDGGGTHESYDEADAPVSGVPRLSMRPVQVGDVRVIAQAPRPTELSMSLYDASGRALATVRNVKLNCGNQTIDFSRLCGLGDLATGSYFLRYETDNTHGMLRFTTAR